MTEQQTAETGTEALARFDCEAAEWDRLAHATPVAVPEHGRAVLTFDEKRGCITCPTI